MTNSRLVRSGLSVSLWVAALILGSAPLMGQHEVRVQSVPGTPGQMGSLTISAISTGEISGVSFGLCIDPTQLSSLVLSEVAGQEYDTFFVVESPTEGIGVGIVFDFFLVDVLPAGIEHPVATLSYAVDPGATQDISVAVCDLVVPMPPLESIMSDAMASELSVTPVPGVISIGGGGTNFLRGDFDGDGMIQIIDAIRILGWAFLGEADPGCLASIDVNGDNSIAGLLVPILLLQFLFLSGPPPAAPYPNCGGDPGSLDCQMSGQGCP